MSSKSNLHRLKTLTFKRSQNPQFGVAGGGRELDCPPHSHLPHVQLRPWQVIAPRGSTHSQRRRWGASKACSPTSAPRLTCSGLEDSHHSGGRGLTLGSWAPLLFPPAAHCFHLLEPQRWQCWQPVPETQRFSCWGQFHIGCSLPPTHCPSPPPGS